MVYAVKSRRGAIAAMGFDRDGLQFFRGAGGGIVLGDDPLKMGRVGAGG